MLDISCLFSHLKFSSHIIYPTRKIRQSTIQNIYSVSVLKRLHHCLVLLNRTGVNSDWKSGGTNLWENEKHCESDFWSRPQWEQKAGKDNFMLKLHQKHTTVTDIFGRTCCSIWFTFPLTGKHAYYSKKFYDDSLEFKPKLWKLG